MGKKFIAGFVFTVFLFVFSGMAQATMLTSKIIMDDGFSAYWSTSDTEQGTLIGSGGIIIGNPNGYNTTYTFTTDLKMGVDYYLHVYGKDGGGNAGFTGSFYLSGNDHFFENNTTTLLTNSTTGWVASYTGWGTYTAPIYGSGPINSNGQKIWAGDWSINDNAYFSTKISVTPVPLPAALPLLGSGLALLGLIRRRSAK